MGRVGEIELGAVGNAGLFYMLFVLIATGFTSGLQIIIGRRNGEKDYETIGSNRDCKAGQGKRSCKKIERKERRQRQCRHIQRKTTDKGTELERQKE